MNIPTVQLLIFDKAIRGAQDLLMKFFWDIVDALIKMINSILDALINGVLGLDIFTNNSFISGAFKFCLALMFAIIPMKIVYELVSAMIRDDDAGLDVHKKLSSAFFGILIACSLTIGITQVINPMIKQATSILLGVNVLSTDSSGTTTNNAQIGDSLVETVLVGFGNMQKGGDYGAKDLVKQSKESDFNIVERYDADDDQGHEKYEYKWNFSYFATIVGLAIYVVMLFMITIQIASRMIAIGFYYVIGPLCCTSLTNYQNPQAFTVWKNSLLGQWAMNLTQIFLLALMTSLITSITKATGQYPVACAALYFGAFSLTLSAPSFVQAMIGGYNAGIMDMMQQFRGGFGLAKGVAGATIGKGAQAIGGGAGKILASNQKNVSEGLQRLEDESKAEALGRNTNANISTASNGGSNSSGGTGGVTMDAFGQEASNGTTANSTARRNSGSMNRSRPKSSPQATKARTAGDMARKAGATVGSGISGASQGVVNSGVASATAGAVSGGIQGMQRASNSTVQSSSAINNASSVSGGFVASSNTPVTDSMASVTTLGNRTSNPSRPSPRPTGVNTNVVRNTATLPTAPVQQKQQNVSAPKPTRPTNTLGNRGGRR